MLQLIIMVDHELEMTVLGVFYTKKFEGPMMGFLCNHVDKHLCDSIDSDVNEILKARKNLESLEMIYMPSKQICAISSYGIDVYEKELPPSQVSRRIAQRKHILEFLKEIYDNDVDRSVNNQQLADGLGTKNNNELKANLKYLTDYSLINSNLHFGDGFSVRLTAAGYSMLDGPNDHGESVPMTSAYKILFILENQLRKFVEKRLTKQFGETYWQDGISKNLRYKVDKFKEEEDRHLWQVSETKTNMEYLQFPDLLKIIKTNQEEFKKDFSDIEQIELRLNELEEIRNAIAHMRTLSEDSIIRLEQYNRDLLNLTCSVE